MRTARSRSPAWRVVARRGGSVGLRTGLRGDRIGGRGDQTGGRVSHGGREIDRNGAWSARALTAPGSPLRARPCT
eukprot:5954071-Alexandrium_andersonii.AAC.1